MVTDADRKQLSEKGISEAQLGEQLSCFKTGFPYLKLSAAASVDKGILVPSDEERAAYTAAWDAYVGKGSKVLKFVPASGAASRMFKDLFAFADASYDVPQTDFEKHFFEHIHDFAFFEDLDVACTKCCDAGVDALVEAGRYKDVVRTLLGKDGLNYGQLPKGLLKFHRYPEGARTPLEEHLVEGALYAQNADKTVPIHFTVSPEHRPLFEQLIKEKAEQYARKYGVRYDITLSEQKPSTDTVAVTPENELFRDARETSETAEEDEPGDDGRDDARHRKRRPEGRVHGLRDRIRLHGVADAAERDDDGDREEDGEGLEFLAEPLRDVVGRTAHDVAVGVMPLVGLRENRFGEDRRHPEEGRDPKPEERARTARNEGRRGTGDVPGTHLGGDGRGERLKRTHPRLVGAFAEEGSAAEEVARGEPELADLNESKLDGVEDPRPAQKRNEEEYAPKDAVDF